MTATDSRRGLPSGAGHQAVRVWLAPRSTPEVDLTALVGRSDGILFDDGHRRMVGIGTAFDLTLGPDEDGAAVLVHLRQVLLHADVGTPSVGAGRGRFGHPVVAFGALGFERAPAVLHVPALLYVEEADGTRWTTITTAADKPMPQALPRPDPAAIDAWLARCSAQGNRPRHRATEPATVVAVGGMVHFDDALDRALVALRRGDLDKVVLARHVDVAFRQPPDVTDLLRRWRDLEPTCTLFVLPAAGGRFVGASPELLVARHGETVESWPLAGTAARGDDPQALLASPKDTMEHRLVVEAIAGALGPLCRSLTVPEHPEVVRLRSVDHLGTHLHGRLQAVPGNHPPDVVTLTRLLHPTPAVAGAPSAAALERIAASEPEPRGPYAGPVGYVDGDGDGVFVLGIRSALLTGDTARVCAGVGLVAASVAATERAEVELKLGAVLAALAPAGVSAPAPA
ncbi:MAG: isochorismate synthase [Acidimicrobiales bacterium]